MSSYSLFSVLGIEIEYMLVDSQSLNVKPISDQVLAGLGEGLQNELSLGEINVSNEFVLHVLELKNNGPKPIDAPVMEQFQAAIQRLQPLLRSLDARLLPGAAHPWMDPSRETQRWPHGNMEIYRQYDRIFNCQGHGWANLQSMHLNLPFANDEEFARLHQLIRLVLPLLPAIAASSPFLEGKRTEFLDSRLSYYGRNQAKIPSISGGIIPEPIFSEAEYQSRILTPMYQDMRAEDPEGILCHEWLNSRAAIPKFAYKALEIRILDSQECLLADLAIAKLLFVLLKHWNQQLQDPRAIAIDSARLKALYDSSIRLGFETQVEDMPLLALWGLPAKRMSLADVWSQLIETVSKDLDSRSQKVLEQILIQGNLSQRLIKAAGPDFSHERLQSIYRDMSDCLLNNQLFEAL